MKLTVFTVKAYGDSAEIALSTLTEVYKVMQAQFSHLTPAEAIPSDLEAEKLYNEEEDGLSADFVTKDLTFYDSTALQKETSDKITAALQEAGLDAEVNLYGTND